jgi:Zn-dependent protease with chaperone function
MVSGVLLFSLPGKLLTLPEWANTLCILTGGALGVGFGLLANFALGAYHLKKILPVTAITDESLRTLLTECFTHQGLAAPELWRVETERAREATALIAGFNGGRWVFRPGLFLSRSAIEALTPTELSAVVLHEVAHLKLRHLRKRLLSSAGLIVGLTIAATFVVFLSLLALPDGPGRTLVSYAAAAGAMIISFRGLAAQSRRHELEADRYAVRRLNADPAAMIEALRKFDRINQVQPAGDGPGPKLGTHPSTADRVSALERMIVSESAVPAEANESEKRAA